MARTFGVRSVASKIDESDIMQGYNASLGAKASFPGGEYGSRDIVPNYGQSINLDLIEGDYEQVRPNLGAQTVLNQETPQEISASPQIVTSGVTSPMDPTKKDESYYKDAIDKYNKAESDKEYSRQMRGVLEIMETASGLMDAYFKDKAIVNQNNYNIMQANRQIVAVQNQAAFISLREQTKTQSRQSSAKMDAVARGQSSTGDVSNVAQNNEEMFLAQNLMSIEISAMRSILGLEQDIIQYEASSQISGYQRNASMVSELASGAIRLGAL